MFLLGILWTGLTENAAFTGLLVGFAMGLIKFIVENVYAPPDCGEEDTRPQFAKLHFMYYCKYPGAHLMGSWSTLCLQSNYKNRWGIISFRYCRNVEKITCRYEGQWLQINQYLQNKQTNAQKHAWLRLKFSRLYIVTQASNIAVKHDSSVGRAFAVRGSILDPLSRVSQ